MKFSLLPFLAFLFFVSELTAQTEDADATRDNSLSSQYQELKKESNNYQVYKVVRETSLDALFKGVTDSINAYRSEIATLNAEQNTLNKTVGSLKSQVNEREESLADQEYQIEHMSFLGMSLTKGTYVTFTWVLIFILLTVAVVLYLRFNTANRVTVRTKSEYDALQSDFEAQKQRARETETKIKRELQTELNRVEELKEQLGDA